MIELLLILIILFVLIFLLLSISNIEIDIDNIKINTKNKRYEKIENFLFNIRLIAFGKITWLKIRIDKETLKKIKHTKFFKERILKNINNFDKLDKFLKENKKQIFNMNNLKNTKKLKIEIKKLKLNIELCTSSNIFTSFSVAVIAWIVSVLLAKNINKYNKDKFKYKITPVYNYSPSIIIHLESLISVKIIDILNIIYNLKFHKNSVNTNNYNKKNRIAIYN